MRRSAWLAAPTLILALMLAGAAGAAAASRAQSGFGSSVGPAVIPLPRNTPMPPPQAAPIPPPVRTYVMELLQTGDLSPEMVQQLTPLHSLAEVEALLKQNHIPFNWRISDISTAGLSPQMVAQIDGLPPHEVFVIPEKGGVVMAVVLETRQGPPATP